MNFWSLLVKKQRWLVFTLKWSLQQGQTVSKTTQNQERPLVIPTAMDSSAESLFKLSKIGHTF